MTGQLRQPTCALTEPGYGALHPAGMVAPHIAPTSLQSDTIARWNSRGERQRETGLRRPAGLATLDGQVPVSSQLGTIARLGPDSGHLDTVFEAPGVRWDNQLTIVRRS